MDLPLPKAEQRVLQTAYGPVLGSSYSWPGGQYCAIHTHRGLVGCGIYDVSVAGQFGMAVAIARGTPAHPLRQPEDLLQARIVEVSPPAERLGIRPGMTGQEAVERMLSVPPMDSGPVA